MKLNLFLITIIVSNLGFYIWNDETLVVNATLFDVIVFLNMIRFFNISPLLIFNFNNNKYFKMSNIVKSKIIAIKSNEVYEDFFNNLKKYPFIINNFNITEIQFNLRKITFLNLIKTLNHAKFFLQINQVFIFYLIQKNFQYRINFNYILKQIEKIRLKNKKAYKIKARKKIARFKR